MFPKINEIENNINLIDLVISDIEFTTECQEIPMLSKYSKEFWVEHLKEKNELDVYDVFKIIKEVLIFERQNLTKLNEEKNLEIWHKLEEHEKTY
jgi:hypothetical protein